MPDEGNLKANIVQESNYSMEITMKSLERHLERDSGREEKR